MTQQIIIQNNIHGSSTYSPNNQTQTTKHKPRRTYLPFVSRTSSSMPQEDAIIVLFTKLTLIQFLLIPADSFGRGSTYNTNLKGITIDALKTLYDSSTQVYNLG